MNNIKATLISKEGGERIIYAGVYKEFFACNLVNHSVYKNAIVLENCKLLIEGISTEEKITIIEQMDFEMSLHQDCKMKKWKAKDD